MLPVREFEFQSDADRYDLQSVMFDCVPGLVKKMAIRTRVSGEVGYSPPNGPKETIQLANAEFSLLVTGGDAEDALRRVWRIRGQVFARFPFKGKPTEVPLSRFEATYNTRTGSGHLELLDLPKSP